METSSRSTLRLALCALALLTGSLATSVEAQQADSLETDYMMATVKVQYTCDEATALRWDRNRYEALEPEDQVIVDARSKACKYQEEDRTEKVVLLVNPAPTSSNDRVFYGILSRAKLDNARQQCAWASRPAGIAIAIIGTAVGTPAADELGMAVFKYGNVSCESIADGIEKDNALVVLGPTLLVSHAVAGQITGDLVRNIPLISNADKKKIAKVVQAALKPPEVTLSSRSVKVEAAGVKATVGVPKVTLPPLKRPKFKL